ncbi:gamma-glutamyltransferase family protein [Streptomyces sp. NBC_00019]|uniref:gamma-glutamyltransferase family protein n=1 Tax=Streptomyces sp. NBC_00019 TaxID=2975623 RepID=UPI00325339A1
MTAGPPDLLGTHGAVSSSHWLATAAGMATLNDGGNAFDAAVAAGFVLAVVEPHSNGLGGDACIVAHHARSGRTSVISGQGPMPAAATLAHFQDLGLRQIPGSGLLPATVPGAFGAWLRMLAEFGTKSLRDVMTDAIGYAERGHPLVADAARAIGSMQPLFATEWESSGAMYLDAAGNAPATGDRMRYPELASTMRCLVEAAEAAGSSQESQIEAAHRAFYQGFVAEAIDGFATRSFLDSTGRHHSGLLTGQDLAAWTAPVEESLSVAYREFEVHKSGPWSQGPVFLQQLALLAGIDLTAYEFGGAPYIHTLTEVAKLAFADREAWYGDQPDGRETIEALLDPGTVAARRALIGPAATPDPAHTDLPGRHGFVPDVTPNTLPDMELSDWFLQLQNGLPTIVPAAALRASLKPGDTCTVVVADREGNLVAAIPSGGWLKSSPVVPGLGFPLGTRGQTMWLVPGHPNSLAPGRRPRTTLSPSVALRDGKPYLAYGTPGGDRQDQWTLESFLAVADFGMGLQQATDIPHFHTDHVPASFTPRARRRNTVVVESAPDAELIAALKSRGHNAVTVPPMSLGAKVCIVAAPDTQGMLRAAAGTRGSQAQAMVR